MIAKSARILALLTALGVQTMPALAQDRGVFIDQIGNDNQTRIDQSSNGQAGSVTQDGDRNNADVRQNDGGAHSAAVSQDGDDNSVSVVQSGVGSATATIDQTGVDNSVLLAQQDNGGLGSIAEIVQTGTNNGIALVQDGTDNQAALIQNGDNNVMTAIQTGNGNRLQWTQDGSGLADLGITQTGGATTIVTQSN